MDIETLNAGAALLHAGQAIAVIALTAWHDAKPTPPPQQQQQLFDGGKFQLERNVRVWGANGTSTTLAVPSGTLDVRYMMIAFFVISAAFQGAASALMRGRSGALRYVEYSLTASVMVLAIAVEAGLRDVYSLECMFVLTWVTMLLGIAADCAQTPQTPWLWLLPHGAGWVTCIAAYAPILDVFLLAERHSERQPPAFVRVLVFLEFAMFACFGFVQAYALTAKAYILTQQGPYIHDQAAADDAEAAALHAVDERAELVFIVLSLAAKTQLCWIILAPTML